MKISKFGRWKIKYDPKATSHCYAQLPHGSGCLCHDCRNFMAATHAAFPAKFRAIARELGVSLNKPAELCHYCREDSGLHLVGGWYHFVGQIVSGADAMKPVGECGWTHDFEKLPSGFESGFTSRLDLVPAPFKKPKLVQQLNFTTRIPWVIPEPEST
jgi:hypothetical protein